MSIQSTHSLDDKPTDPPAQPARSARVCSGASTPSGSRLAVLTPSLRKLLSVLAVALGLLAVNSAYLAAITWGEWFHGEILENRFYLLMFLAHLGLGLLVILPLGIFASAHLYRAWRRPNRWAVRAGLGLLLTLILLIGSGLLLTRFGFFEVNDPQVRTWAYRIHVVSPLVALWLFVLHRLAGHRPNWRPLLIWGGWALGSAGVALALHLSALGPPRHPERLFEPALARVSFAGERAAPLLMRDAFCAECHGDIAARHAGSAHRLSSFNNPVYRFSVEETRRTLLERDGSLTGARLCAVCHDPVPLFSGRFDDPDYRPEDDPGSEAGITCMACHGIRDIGSPRGNGDYLLEMPPGYPFEFSEHPLLRAINRQLIRAKPAFHKKTLLRPLHRNAEFCGACHKVHIPVELNQYRWLRGQNHLDSFLLSGISGHRVDSFYYPDQAIPGCNQCHMPGRHSGDPAARALDGVAGRGVHDHRFAAANTALPALVRRPQEDNVERLAMLENAARLDLFGLREGGTIDGALLAPLRPEVPVLVAGRAYLLELVVRTTGVGHALTQGTSDSNELWLDVTLRAGSRVIGRSGALAADGSVDPWAYFINAYGLDREGRRIDRRNVQDVFVALYDHQIPPGAATLVQYRVRLPEDLEGQMTIEVALRYRKFDTELYRQLLGESFVVNDLPIATLATDVLSLTVMPEDRPRTPPQSLAAWGHAPRDAPDQEWVSAQMRIPAWERWNDYGIGLLRQGRKGRLRQAAEAFSVVESLRPGEGALNLARVFYEEGRLDEAADALQRAAPADPPAPSWTIAWYGALIERDLGYLDAAIANLEALADTRFASARERGFDFSRDYRMLTELGRTLYERARQIRGEARRQERESLLVRAAARLEQSLRLDPEHPATHHALSLVYLDLGRIEEAAVHQRLHESYRSDDQAIARAVSLHRTRNPAADRAAEPIVIHDLQRFETPGSRAGHTESWPFALKQSGAPAR